MRVLTVRDMRNYMIGAAIFSQGQPENFLKSLILIDRMKAENRFPRMISSLDVPDDALVCQVWQRSGGGYEYQDGELVGYLGNKKGIYEEKSFEKTYAVTIEKIGRELEKSATDKIFGYITYCTSSSQGILPMYLSAVTGKPFVDCDCAGTAMWPHLDEAGELACEGTQILCSPYGETIVFKDFDKKRHELIREYFHKISGCWFLAVCDGLARYKEYKKCIVKGQTSRMIEAGLAVTEARVSNKDPVTAFIDTVNARKLFSGVVESFHIRKTGGVVEGFWEIGGRAEFYGHKYKIWFSMENRISWLDEQVSVTIPDIVAVVDSMTCESLSALEDYGERIVEGSYVGREVTVIGIEADGIWYKLGGAIECVNRKLSEYGFCVSHRPLKEVV